MDWLDRREELIADIARHVHVDFQLHDSLVVSNPITGNKDTVGELLEEIASRLHQHDEPPFTYQRLAELSRMEHADDPLLEIPKDVEMDSVNAENNRDMVSVATLRTQHGISYIRAAMQLTQVSSCASVFEDFEDLLNAAPSLDIKLKPLHWASSINVESIPIEITRMPPSPHIQSPVDSLDSFEIAPGLEWSS